MKHSLYSSQDYHLTIVVHFPETYSGGINNSFWPLASLGLTRDIKARYGDDTYHHPEAAMIQRRELDKVANPGHDNTVNLMFYTGGWVLPVVNQEPVIENKMDFLSWKWCNGFEAGVWFSLFNIWLHKSQQRNLQPAPPEFKVLTTSEEFLKNGNTWCLFKKYFLIPGTSEKFLYTHFRRVEEFSEEDGGWGGG